ncbi:MAG: tetratricopeptide repeat protein [Oscillospiraceae bacterium]|nr:tetratricopeptide repeat protein [Oscillospiraceae bacterium]
MKWLHISDLHYNPSNSNFDTRLLLTKLYEYIKENIDVDAVVYTGDFRFAKQQEATQENARLAAEKLREIANNAGVSDPRYIHIVPGNHDLERGDVALIDQAYKEYANGAFSGSLTYNGIEFPCIDYLASRFKFFEMVAAELSNQVWVDIPTDNRHKYHRIATVAGMYNIIYLNTAIGSGKNGERGNLLAGYEHIANAFVANENYLPTIVLGHHGLGCFTRRERERIIEIFRQKNVVLYLCGDEHIGGIDEYDTIIQLTAGCLNQNGTGVEPTFYTGEIDQSGLPIITAYTYLDGAYPGWSKSEPMNKKIDNWITKSFPSTATEMLRQNYETSKSALAMIYGCEDEIKEMSEFLKEPQGKTAEVWGVEGIGKTTVSIEVQKKIINDHIIVETRYIITTTQIQEDTLPLHGIGVGEANIHPNELAQAVELTNSLGDNLSLPNVLSSVSNIESLYGDKDAALGYYLQAEELYRSLGDNLGLSEVLLSMGDLESLYGDQEAAHVYYLQAEKLYRSLGNNLGIANVMRSIGDLESLSDDVETARGYYVQAEELYRFLGDNLGLANALSSIGNLESMSGDIETARGYYEKAEELYRSLGDNLGLANVLSSIGELESMSGDIDVAHGYYMQAEELYRSLGDNLGLANVLRSIGKLEILYGDIDSSITFYEEALKLYVVLGTPIGSTQCYAELCYAYAKKADEHNFIKYAKETIASLDRVNNDFVEYAINLVHIAMEIIGYEGTIISL